jgi:penicillin-binding protein 2
MANRFTERKFIIQAIMIGVALVWVLRLLYLQVIDTSYQLKADSNVMERIVNYPSRGLILDKDDRPLVDNQVAYDVMVIYKQVRKMDTMRFCNVLEIDKATFIRNLHHDFKKEKAFSPVKAYAFLKNITHTQYTKLQESLYEFPGFAVRNRVVRSYPDSIGTHLIGYMSEANEDQVKKGNYQRGDYLGSTGLEKYYEKELRGIPGIRYVLRDNRGQQKGRYENGARDTVAVSGQDLLTSIDLDVQKLAESLMRNKRGGVIAVDPRTGEIIALTSGPYIDPNALSVQNRRRSVNLFAMYQNPNKPLLNRVLNAKYPPGSTFKTGMAALEMQLGWDPERSVGCGGGYRLSARKRVGCHRHGGTGNISGAVQHSCNTYFCSSFFHTLNTFNNVANGLDTIHGYLEDYGFARKVGIDMPGEAKGSIPSSKLYNKTYGAGKWNANTIISMGIGQGEVLVTPTQMVNLAQCIGNRGWYYTPHVVKALRFNGKDTPVDMKYRTKNRTRISQGFYDYVAYGMYNMGRTNKNVNVGGLEICGKTGTAQNPQGKDNSAFICFAPKDNPKIAVAVYVENAGFGAQFAAPIASMIVEQYINGEMKRKPLLKKMRSAVLVKAYTPDTVSSKPLIQINSTLLPASDSMKKIQQTQPDAPRIIITPQAIMTPQQPIAKPAPVPATPPTTPTPNPNPTIPPVVPPVVGPQPEKQVEPPKIPDGN